MTGRGERVVYRQDNGRAITSEDIYTMVMLYTYQKMSVEKIARRYAIRSTDARTLIGKRTGGSCCG